MSPKTACATCLPATQRFAAMVLPPTIDDRIREADLAVQLERARLHGERARRRARPCRLVDDPDAHAQPRQPQGQHQPGRPGADDEDVTLTNRRYTHVLN